MAEAVLSFSNLVVRYPGSLFCPQPKSAVDRVSGSVETGTTLGLIGESGSGKSSLIRAILRLVAVESGDIRFLGQDWLGISGQMLRRERQKIGLVAQNPFLSLSPTLSVRQILSEPLWAAGIKDRQTIEARITERLERCGLPASFLDRRAHQLSGGQAQRVAIARALTLDPKLVILDEPTSALDISVQAQILNLLAELKRDFGLSMLFVTHDLKVARRISDSLAVMRTGQFIETGPTEAIVTHPREDYTRSLLGFGSAGRRG